MTTTDSGPVLSDTAHERITWIDMGPLAEQLTAHTPWLDSVFPPADYTDPSQQAHHRDELVARIPDLAPLLDELSAHVRTGQAVVVGNLPTHNAAMLVALTSALGQVIQSRPDRPLVDDLTAQPPRPDQPDGYGRGALTPHTDNSSIPHPPAVLVLACVVNDSPTGSGDSILVHVDDALAKLAEQAPDSVALLHDETYPTLNVPSDEGKTPVATAILNKRPDSTATARYRGEAVHAGIQSPRRTVTPSRAHHDALAHFTQAVGTERIQARFQLKPGDLLAVDNGRLLHGRTAITTGAARHYKRIYTALDHDS